MKVDTQEIPSELLDDYKTSLRIATQWWTNLFGTFLFNQRRFGIGPNKYLVRGRQPFKLPHMRGVGGNSPSAAQIIIRNAFKRCTNCFDLQPDSGGASPPDLGPRDRSWWYTAAAPSSLWYLNYFVQQSWGTFWLENVPDWCKLIIPDWGGIRKLVPDTNYHDQIWGLIVSGYWSAAPEGYKDARALLKFSATLPIKYFLNALIVRLFQAGQPDTTIEISLITEDWNPATVTWNTKPATGRSLGFFTIPGADTTSEFRTISFEGKADIIYGVELKSISPIPEGEIWRETSVYTTYDDPIYKPFTSP